MPANRGSGCRLLDQQKDSIHDLGCQRSVHPPYPPHPQVVRQANEYEWPGRAKHEAEYPSDGC
jgi:hypothetical protein